MSITYTWNITQLETAPSENGLEHVVKTIHWQYHATDGVYTADIIGRASLDPPDPMAYTPYMELTKEQVIIWLEAKLAPELDELKIALDHKLQNIITPPIVRPSLPWV